MKVGFIEPHLNEGIGGIRRIIEVSNRLKARGHDVSIFTPKAIPCPWLPNTVPIFKLHKLERFKFDCVIFNLAEQYKFALGAKAAHKVFWVLAPEATYKNPAVPVAALKMPFYFLANSQYTIDYIRKYGKVLQAEIPIISGGINPDHFRFDPRVPKTHHVLYFGSPRPWKGSALVESALGGFQDIKINKMEGKHTPQHKMYKLYCSANIYVSANKSEGFSFGQLEAMACGCPCVTTDDGGSRDYVKNGVNALVVDRSVSGIQKGVKRLLGDKSLYTKIRCGGRKTAAEPRFSWEAVTDKVESVLRSLTKVKCPS